MRARTRLLQLALSIAILAYVYSKVPIGAVIETLRGADVTWLLAGVGLVLVLQALVSIRWGLLVAEQGAPVALSSLVAIQLASVFYKLFIPGGMLASIGVRYYKLQSLGGSRPAALSSVVVDRLLATSALGIVGTIAWLADEPPVPEPVGWTIALWGLGMAALVALLVNARAAGTVERLASGRSLRGLSERLLRLLDAFARYRHVRGRRLSVLGVFSLVPHLVGFLVLWALARALQIDIDALSWAWLRAALTLVTTQPISIAGLGVREGMLVWLLGDFGVGQAHALALASLFLGVTVLLPAALGAAVEARALLGAARRRRSR